MQTQLNTVADKMPAWVKPRFAQPLERKRMLMNAKKSDIARLMASSQHKCTSADEKEGKRVERKELSSGRETVAGEFSSLLTGWTAYTSPRGTVSWMQMLDLRVTRPRACTSEGKLTSVQP